MFENYMHDFINLLEFCGAKKLQPVQPLDFHFSIGNTEFFIECKTFIGKKDFTNPNYSFEWVDYPQRTYYHNEIKLLDSLDHDNNCAWLVIWSPVWKAKKYNHPIHYITGHNAFHIAFNSGTQYIHLEANKRSHVFEPIWLLKECPYFYDVFENVSTYDIPFATYEYPNIKDYESPDFSSLILAPGEKREIRGFINDGFGRKKLLLNFPKGDNCRVIPVLNEA